MASKKGSQMALKDTPTELFLQKRERMPTHTKKNIFQKEKEMMRSHVSATPHKKNVVLILMEIGAEQ